MPAPEPTQDAEIATHRWSTRLRAGDRVVLGNELGDLRARGSGDAGLHYAGVVQKLDGETRDPDFVTERIEGGLRLTAKAPADWLGRVDASARGPPASPLALTTGAGLLEVRVDDNDVLAESREGRITVRTAGRIDVRSADGDILAVFLATDFTGEPAGSVSTDGGDIEVWLRPTASLTVDLEAGGGIDVDAGDAASVERVDEGGARVVLGSGDGRLPVRTRAGTLTLRVLPE